MLIISLIIKYTTPICRDSQQLTYRDSLPGQSKYPFMLQLITYNPPLCLTQSAFPLQCMPPMACLLEHI